MTNEELLQITDDKLVEKFIGSWVIAMEDIGPVPPLEVRQRAKNAHAQFKAELLCRLGAAVSASPQPRPYKDGDAQKWFEDYCYEHHINFAKRIETGGEETKRLDELVPEILEAFLSQFFAAAPAQEPRQVRNLDEIDESHIAAQEQPVENRCTDSDCRCICHADERPCKSCRADKGEHHSLDCPEAQE